MSAVAGTESVAEWHSLWQARVGMLACAFQSACSGVYGGHGLEAVTGQSLWPRACVRAGAPGGLRPSAACKVGGAGGIGLTQTKLVRLPFR